LKATKKTRHYDKHVLRNGGQTNSLVRSFVRSSHDKKKKKLWLDEGGKESERAHCAFENETKITFISVDVLYIESELLFMYQQPAVSEQQHIVICGFACYVFQLDERENAFPRFLCNHTLVGAWTTIISELCFRFASEY